MAKIIGIDLGTTNSAVAIIEAGQPKIIENAEGNRTTPSVVSVNKNGERAVGQIAKRQAVTNPENTIYGVKRFMGHSFADEEVQNDIPRIAYKLKASSNGGVSISLGGKDSRPEEISAMILQKIKSDVEAKTGETVTQAVITVPAYFNDTQRQATIDAGKIAGLEVMRIIPEPTAAALAYGFNSAKNEKIAVYDFGGGTFDISILEVGDGVVEVKSVDGDSHLGGRDIDQKFVEYIAAEFKKDQGIDVSKDALALQRLDEAAEKAKHELSTQMETEINLPFITSGADGPKHLVVKVTRAKLEEISKEFVERSIEITKRAIAASPFKKEEIHEIIMVGGQTRMPMILEAVKELFGKEPNRSINPDEVVALGAAVQAGVLQGDVKDVLLLDVIPLSLGIETMGGVATKLVEKNMTIPTSKSQIFSTASDNQTSVEIHITQGERPLAADNKSLGRFILDGIPPAPRGMPQVEVTFDVDANGILNVTAKDKTSGKVQTIRIEASSGLTDEDIKRMQSDAESHADEDKKKMELVETKNMADAMVHTAEKALKDAGDKISDEIKKEVTDAIGDVKTARGGEDKDVLTKATESLSEKMMKIGEAMKSANDAAQESTATESTEAPKDDGAEKVDSNEQAGAEESKKDDTSTNA
ncbi:molecular chaperone DnaK [Candidatus Gracilibacteria bacterium]|nr:molecular chaperone DnaK [Candidatus Gracilibacteria bacterium]MCF7898414.1 molecular chaperone DnaK [Candidatus Paceibacterota bacterium]